MNKKIIISVLSVIIFLTLALSVSANETIITVVVPTTTEETVIETDVSTTEPPAVTPVAIPKLYPVSVTENISKGRREIVKKYELSNYEKPSDIPRESFVRDGWLYELADITKKENIKTEEKNHTETVKIDSATKDFDEILKLLTNTKTYKSGGFTGTLTLDMSSITVEQAGTKSVAYTLSESREYPYLSSNDTSYIPKTIVDKYNRTLTLSNLTWRTSSVAVDYDSIPDSYTACATYTGTGYRTVITGYDVTAQYIGVISKTSNDKTIYTASFIGTEIVSPVIETTTVEIVTEMPEEPEITTEPEVIIPVEIPTITEADTEIPTVLTTEPTEETTESKEPQTKKDFSTLILTILLLLETAGFIGFIVYTIKKKQITKSEGENSNE